MYSGEYLNRIAFPVGGMAPECFVWRAPELYHICRSGTVRKYNNEPVMFAAVAVKGMENGAKVLEGQVPEWKHFGNQIRKRILGSNFRITKIQ
jgi:hypothetical protein